MAELQVMQSPLISDRALRRLRLFARPKPHTAESTVFDMGYERCKQDLLELIHHDFADLAEKAELHTAAAQRKKRWWER